MDTELARGTVVEVEGKVNQDLTIQGTSLYVIPEDQEPLGRIHFIQFF